MIINTSCSRQGQLYGCRLERVDLTVGVAIAATYLICGVTTETQSTAATYGRLANNLLNYC